MLNKNVGPSHERGRGQVRGVACGDLHRAQWQRFARSGLMAALLLGGLAGCGGGDGDSDSTDSSAPPSATPPVSQTIALDGFRAVRPGVTTRVDLSTFVRGTGTTLSAMDSEQAGCSASNLSGLSADVISDGGLCEFTYQVSGQSGDASATLNTLASDKASPVIPPVSQTMTLAEPNKAFDLTALLGADWPAGYNLDPASLVVQGGSAQGTATASGNVLTYTHPGEAVWNRILFTLTDPAKPGEDAFGALYVTVSDSANQPPTIGEPKYDYSAQNGSVVTFQEVTLDLATLPGLGIVDPEGGEWQLVEVQSYSAEVNPVDPNSVTNKQFKFQAGAVGDHIVSYIVGDHEAGFAMGLIKIKVGAAESPKTWNNITIGDKTFQATPLYSEVINRGVMAEAVYDDVVANNVAGVTGAAAKSYCSNGNHLATNDELELLRANGGTELPKYPVERTYVTYDNAGQPLTYELFTGVTAPYDPASSPTQYVICVSDSAAMSYTPNTTVYGLDTGLSDSAWWALGTLVSDGGAGNPVVTVSTNIGSAPLTNANVRLNPAGCPLGTCKIEVRGNPAEYGDMTVRVANAANTATTLDIGPLKLLQNAKASGARLVTNNSPADGSSANTVVVSVTDKDNLPVVSTDVKFKYTVSPTSITIVPGSCDDPVNCVATTTDGNGDATLSLTTSTAGNYTLNLPADASVWGLPTAIVAQADCDGAGQPGTGIDLPGIGCFRQDDGALRTWSDASAYCSSLGGGYSLPTVEQLQALYVAYPYSQINTIFGWNIFTSGYWSSMQASNGQDYTVGLLSGTVNHVSGTPIANVTCVR